MLPSLSLSPLNQSREKNTSKRTKHMWVEEGEKPRKSHYIMSGGRVMQMDSSSTVSTSLTFYQILSASAKSRTHYRESLASTAFFSLYKKEDDFCYFQTLWGGLINQVKIALTYTWIWEFWQWLKPAKLQTELAIKALRKRLKMHHLNALFSGNEDKEGWHFYRKLAEDQPECIHVFFLAIALLLWSGVKEVQWSTCQREMRLRPAFLQCTIVQSFLLAFIR